MRKLHRALGVLHEKCTKEDWDSWLVIAGDEGKGKTHLSLHAFEHYLGLLKVKDMKDSFKFFCLDKKEWKKGFSILPQYYPTVYDEAGELNNRRFMSKFNVEITQLSRVIRGENNLVILTIQDFFDLDPFFVKRRVKGLIYVYKRGQYAYWSQKRLRILAALNKHFWIKNYWVIRPTFYDQYKPYEGVFIDEYKDKKKTFLKEAKRILGERPQEEVDEEKEKFLEIMAMKNQGLSDRKIGLIKGVSGAAINKFINKYATQT